MSAPCEFIDTHAHLDMDHFHDDMEMVIARAEEAGVARIVCAGIDLSSSRQAIELARRYPNIYAAVGIHPEEAHSATTQDIETLATLAHDPHVVAIGEIGLDYYRDYGPHDKQCEVLRWQLELASDLEKPVVIHVRAADDALIPLLDGWHRKYPCLRPGVIHCFNGNYQNAQAYLELGFYISLGAYIGYPSAKAMREVVAQLPLERLLLETDSPFLPPQSCRGKRNEPSYLIEAASELTRLKNLSLADIASATTLNATHVFGKLS